MGKVAHFRNFQEENCSEIPAHWIYQSVNFAFKLLSANQIALNRLFPIKAYLIGDRFSFTCADSHNIHYITGTA